MIQEIIEHYHALGRHVWHLASKEDAVSSSEVMIIVEDQGRALIVDIGWDPDVGVHANIRAVAGEEYISPQVFALDDTVLITAK